MRFEPIELQDAVGDAGFVLNADDAGDLDVPTITDTFEIAAMRGRVVRTVPVSEQGLFVPPPVIQIDAIEDLTE